MTDLKMLKIKLLPLIIIATVSVKQNSTAGLYVPGNFIIGGLFPFHKTAKPLVDFLEVQHSTCSDFDPSGLAHSLVMIHAVNAANDSPLLRGLGVTLGYHIRDTCSDVTTALRAIEQFTQHCTSAKDTSDDSQPVTVVIGAYYSEVTIAVARQLNLYFIPQISYSSTANILSDKDRFPDFMRTVPSDVHQTATMVELLHKQNWTWVGILTTDGDYGRAALDSFVTRANEIGICVSFIQIFPDCLNDEAKLQKAVSNASKRILDNHKVKVVVSFAKPQHMKSVFEELLKYNSDRRVWVASDIWSVSKIVLQPEQLDRVGWVIGFSFKSRDFTELKEYFQSVELKYKIQQNNIFLKEFFSTTNNISLMESAQSGVVLSIQMAVNAVAQAIARLCQSRNCTVPGALKPKELLQTLKNMPYQQHNISYAFDKNGDVNLGYDISMWEKDEDIINMQKVVIWYQPSKELDMTKFKLNLESKCSESCKPGQFKKSVEGQHTCCYSCISCPENQYSNTTDSNECYSCGFTEWAEKNSSECKPKTVEFFSWQDPFAIVLVTLCAFGVFIVAVVSLLFFMHRHSPVVKAAGGWLCQLILVSLTGSFISTVLFIGEPTDKRCKARQVLYGLSFAMCVSCILVKSLNILLAFQMNLTLKEMLHRLYKPYAIVGACMSLQTVICTCWLVLISPRQIVTPSERAILMECNEGSTIAFGVMLGYIALLALICVIIAFQCRKLPEKYNEARFITFSMLLYLITWIIFIPTYVNTKGKYLPAVEMIVILISNYGVLCCHFLPKCYIIIFRKTKNTRDAFIQSIYEYSKRTVANLGSLRRTAPSPATATTNPAFVAESGKV